MRGQKQNINGKLTHDLHALEPEVQLSLGPVLGDITRVVPSSLEQSDGLVSGPPCPPYSDMGGKLAEHDPRSRVFDNVCDFINDLAERGVWWFAIENVLGILKRRAGQEPFGQTFKARMFAALPSWQIEVWTENSLSHGVPQSRRRVFFIGTSQWMRRTALQRRLLKAGPLRSPTVSLLDCLDKVSI